MFFRIGSSPIGGNRGFTLIEILITVGIILVLAVLCLPVAQSMVERSKSAKCVQRVKAIVAGEILYASDNQGVLPPFQDINGGLYGPYWSERLAPYVTGKEFDRYSNEWMRCPSLTNMYSPGQHSGGIGPVYTSFLLGPSFHLMHSDRYAGYSMAEAGGSMLKISKPAQTPAYMDISGGYAVGNPAYCRACFPGGAIALNAGLKITDANNFAQRHNRGANVGFLDGHVEWVPYTRLKNATTAGDADFFRHFDP